MDEVENYVDILRREIEAHDQKITAEIDPMFLWEQTQQKIRHEILESIDNNVKELGKSKLNLGGCQHKWKQYQGIIDTYDYCETCDQKRRL